MIASEYGRRHDENRDGQSCGRRFRSGECKLRNAERRCRSDDSNDNREYRAHAILKGESGGNSTDVERQRLDGEREQEPAEQGNAEDAEYEASHDHGGGFREIRSDVRPSTPTTARGAVYTKSAHGRSRFFTVGRLRQQCRNPERRLRAFPVLRISVNG